MSRADQVPSAPLSWAYAMLGAADRVSDSLARAQDELGRADEGTVPAWARLFLAPADLDGMSGVIYGLASHADHRIHLGQNDDESPPST